MRLTICALAAVVLLLLAGCGESDGSDGENDEAAAPAATAGPGTGDTLVHGVVTRDGEPVAGADVSLTLWPEDIGDLDEGDPVDTWDSPPVETGADGGYALRLDPDTVAGRYFGGSFLNFDLAVEDGDSRASWSSSVGLIDDTMWRSDQSAQPGDDVMTMDLDLGAASITVTDSFGDHETSELIVMPAVR